MAKQTIRAAFENVLAYKELAAQKPLPRPYKVPDVLREEMSDHSIEIMEHFGVEAAANLNQYTISLEDALIKQVQKASSYREKCLILADEVMRLRELVADNNSQSNALQSDD